MINTYFVIHQFFEPFTLFRDLYRGKTLPFAPNSHSFTVLVYSVCRATREGLEVHGVVVKNGFCLDLYVATALVDMYVKFGVLGSVRRVFDEMPVKRKRKQKMGMEEEELNDIGISFFFIPLNFVCTNRVGMMK
ncbi:hypothetical protein RJT34_31798 [Clitoria ternatea]|uniref:Pentatricopeptide repeat-containing protein n=1 Tax=Clitoria ternatea TaxID=43366 RepID=A0AAN9EWI2_CLITE